MSLYEKLLDEQLKFQNTKRELQKLKLLQNSQLDKIRKLKISNETSNQLINKLENELNTQIIHEKEENNELKKILLERINDLEVQFKLYKEIQKKTYKPDSKYSTDTYINNDFETIILKNEFDSIISNIKQERKRLIQLYKLLDFE